MSKTDLDFTFLFWELENSSKTPLMAWPCQGYPHANLLIPAMERVGAKFQNIELHDYIQEKEPFKTIGEKIESDKIVVEWDGIFNTKDWRTLLGLEKEIYVILHNEMHSETTPAKETMMRKEITEKSKNVIFQSEWGRNLWKENKCDKQVILYPPTRTGKVFDREMSRYAVGITSKYALICWGFYSGKNYEAMMPVVNKWKDTSILFCGCGDKIKLQNEAKRHNISNQVFFSPSGISEEDSDLWFSAADIHAYPRTTIGTSTLVDVIGHGLCSVAPPIDIYIEMATLSGTVITKDVGQTTRELLLDPEKRKVYEASSRVYAENNSFEKYAIRLGDLMGYKYKEKDKE